MKTMIHSLMSAAAALLVLSAHTSAAEEAAAKPVTLEGTATCAKCDLGTAKKCTSVLQVKTGNKTETYLLAGKAGGDWHTTICKGEKPVKMTGTVTEKSGEKTLDVTEITLTEKAKDTAK